MGLPSWPVPELGLGARDQVSGKAKSTCEVENSALHPLWIFLAPAVLKVSVLEGQPCWSVTSA